MNASATSALPMVARSAIASSAVSAIGQQRFVRAVSLGNAERVGRGARPRFVARRDRPQLEQLAFLHAWQDARPADVRGADDSPDHFLHDFSPVFAFGSNQPSFSRS